MVGKRTTGRHDAAGFSRSAAVRPVRTTTYRELLMRLGNTLAVVTFGMLSACMDPVATSDDVAQPSVVAQPHVGGARILNTLTGAQIRSAYKVTNHGAGTTKIATIMAGGYTASRVLSDFQANQTHNSLHTGATLTIVNSSGNTSPLPAKISDAWEQAGATGLQIAQDLADDPEQILVEAASASSADLLTAIGRARTMGATRVILPWVLGTDPGDSAFTTGAVYIAGTDLGGAGPKFPALSAKVLSVSPTTLSPDMSVRGFSEVAVSGAAVGCSTRAKPSFQVDGICPSNLTVPTMTAVGDQNTPVEVYYTPAGGSQGVIDVSGPGVSAALVAGWFGLDASATLANVYGGTAAGQIFDLGTAGFDSADGLGSPNGNPSF